MRDFKDGRGGIGLPAYLTEEEFFQMIRQQLHFCLSKSPQYNKGSWFLEKTPDHLLHVGDIKRVIPNARLIVMTRNSEDVIESMMNAGNGWGSSWAPTSLPGAIKLYKRYEKALDNIFSGQTIMPHDYICVSYENLKKDTTSVVESILDYLELETEPDLINSMIAKPSELYKTGEFGKEHGSLVVEPTGFSRNSKEKLNLVQRSLIAMTTRNSFGYRPG